MSGVGSYLSKSVADSGAIVADSELGDFRAANLLSPQADLAWRGDSAAARLIQINLAQTEVIDTIALCLHNLTSAATIKLDLYDSRLNAPLLTVTETVGGADTIPAYKNHILQFASTNAQEIDITITDTLNPDGYIQVRRLKVGTLTLPVSNFDFGYTFGFVSGEDYRAGEIGWMWKNEAELNAANELIRDYGVDPDKYARTRAGELLGLKDDILWIGYPDATDTDTYNQHVALVALVNADIPYRPNAIQGAFTAQIEEIYYEPIVETPTAYITKWSITSGDIASAVIPTGGTGLAGDSYIVDWGDGESELVAGAVLNIHTYSEVGDYIVTIKGKCQKLSQLGSVDRLRLIEVTQFGQIGLAEISGAYNGCVNVDFTATDTPDVSSISDFTDLFRSCSFSPQFNVSRWDVINGEIFTRMFSGCSGATVFPVGLWDVSSGRLFDGMFGNTLIGLDYQVKYWLITSSENMTTMFLGSNLSNAEYDEILQSWDDQIPLSGAPFDMHFGTAKYSAGAAATARALIVADGITITDGGAA